MQICPNCGATNSATAKFCTTCGTKLLGEKVQPEQPKAEPVISQVEPEQPKVEPVTSQVEPEQPNVQPVASQVEPEQPNVQPVTPTQTAQVQQNTRPQQPQVDPAIQAEQERQRQAQAQVRADQVSKFKESSQGYWDYLVDSWKKPSQVIVSQYNRWFGLISMGIWALLGTISVGHTAQSGIDTVEDTTNSALSLFDSDTAESATSTIQSNAMTVYFKFLLLLIVGMLVFGLVGFLFRKWAQNDKLTFLEYTTDLMHRCNLNLILVLCALLLSLLGGAVQLLSVLLISLGGSIFVIGFMQSIVLPKPRAGFDSVYLTVVAMIALEAALIILMSIFGQSLISQFSSLF